ncbi:MAG: hypothetical protein K2Z81_01260 [Cyanobacteria bacterium]|nr:hypothetical protein [Cyanobacteriota bacterium]
MWYKSHPLKSRGDALNALLLAGMESINQDNDCLEELREHMHSVDEKMERVSNLESSVVTLQTLLSLLISESFPGVADVLKELKSEELEGDVPND